MNRRSETVVFSFIVYKSRRDRDRINKKVMADERLKGADMPFDGKRMIYGGFTTLLRASDVVVLPSGHRTRIARISGAR